MCAGESLGESERSAVYMSKGPGGIWSSEWQWVESTAEEFASSLSVSLGFRIKILSKKMTLSEQDL